MACCVCNFSPGGKLSQPIKNMADATSARIPKIRNKEGITKADINNRDIQNLLADVNKKCLDINFHKEFTVLEVYMLHNSGLQAAYIKKRAELKEEGRNNQSLTDQLGFLHINPNLRSKLDKQGLHTSYLAYNRLGKSHLGVYLNRFFDVELKKACLDNRAGVVKEIAVIKYFAGKCKLMNIGDVYSKNSFVEPTPNYDSHISTAGPQIDESIFVQKAKADIYLYEYNDECEPVKRPRQCLPYAIIKVKPNPVQEKIIPQLTPSAVSSVSSRSAADSTIPVAAFHEVSYKQKPAEALKTQAALDVSQQIPSPSLKDRHCQKETKVKSKVLNQGDKHSKMPFKGVSGEKKREEMRNSYLQRLNLAKATVEAEQSKNWETVELIQNILPDQSDRQQISKVLRKDCAARETVNGQKEQFEGTTPCIQLGNCGLAVSSFDEPPFQANSLQQKPIADQSLYQKTVGSVKKLPLTSTQSSFTSTQEETHTLTVNPKKRIDPRLVRPINNKVAATLSKPDLRLARFSVDEKQPCATSCEPPHIPQATSLIPKQSIIPSKSALNSSEIKRWSVSDYKKRNQESMNKNLSQPNSVQINAKPQSINIPANKTQVFPMPISFKDKTKLPPKPTVLNEKIKCEENKTVPLPSFYIEYTPDGESLYQDLDFNQFQSPVKRSSPHALSPYQFQSPIFKPASNTSPQAKITSQSKPTASSKKSLMPLPVINSDGSVSNVLRGIVDGSMTEIKAPPLASQPPQKGTKKLLINSELVDNMAKNLVRNEGCITQTQNHNKDSQDIHNDDFDKVKNDQHRKAPEGAIRKSQLPTKGTVDKKSIKRFIKGFHKGFSGKSGRSSQVIDHGKKIQNSSNSFEENKNTDTVPETDFIEKTKVTSIKTDKVNRLAEKNVFSDKEVIKPWLRDQNKIEELADQEKEEDHHEKHFKVRSKITYRMNRANVDCDSKDRKKTQDEKDYLLSERKTSNVKPICSPPPLPLIPFLVSEENRDDSYIVMPTKCAEQQKEQSTDSKEQLQKELKEQPVQIPDDNDPLSSGMWLAPEAHELSQSVGSVSLTLMGNALEAKLSRPESEINLANFSKPIPTTDQTSEYGKVESSGLAASKVSLASEGVKFKSNQASNKAKDRVTNISKAEETKEYQSSTKTIVKSNRYSKEIVFPKSKTQIFSKLAPQPLASATVMMDIPGTRAIDSNNVINISEQISVCKVTTSVEIQLPASKSLDMPNPSVSTPLKKSKYEQAVCDKACASSNLDIMSPAMRREEQAYINHTNSLTLEELGFNNTLQVMNSLAFQPNTMLVDCTKALNEKYPLDSCQMCKQLLPETDVKYTQAFLEGESDNCCSHVQSTSPSSISEMQGMIESNFAPMTVPQSQASETCVYHDNLTIPSEMTHSLHNNEGQTAETKKTDYVILHCPGELVSSCAKQRIEQYAEHSLIKSKKAERLECAASSNLLVGPLKRLEDICNNPENLLKDVTNSGNLVPSSELHEPSVIDNVLKLSSTKSEAHNLEPVSHSFEATKMDKNAPYHDHNIAFSSQSTLLTQTSPVVSASEMSTKPNAKESSLNFNSQLNVDGKDQMKVFHGTENLNSQSRKMETGVQGLAGSPEGESEKLKTGETTIGEGRFRKTWDQNHLLANEMDSALMQREQRKNILIQVWKQKEKIQKNFDHVLHGERKAEDKEMKAVSKENQKEREQAQHLKAGQEESVHDKKMPKGSDVPQESFNHKSKEITFKERLLKHDGDRHHISSSEVGEGGRKVLNDSQNNSEKHSKSILESSSQLFFDQSRPKKDDPEMQSKMNRGICLHRSQNFERREGTLISACGKYSHKIISEKHRRPKDKKFSKGASRDGEKGTAEIEASQVDRKSKIYCEIHHKIIKTTDSRSTSRERIKPREDPRQRDKNYKRRTGKPKEILKQREKKEEKSSVKLDMKTADQDENLSQIGPKESISRGFLTDNYGRESRRTKAEKDQAEIGRQKNNKESFQNNRNETEGLSIVKVDQEQLSKCSYSDQRMGNKILRSEEESHKNNKKLGKKEDSSQSDKNSNHLVLLDANQSSISELLLSPNVDAESLMHKEGSSQSSEKLVALTEHADSKKENVEDNSDDEFGAPKKIIQPLKKKILINIPNSAQKQGVNSSPITADEATSTKSVVSVPSIPSFSTVDTSALSHHPCHKDVSNVSLASANMLGKKEVKQILSIRVPETNPPEKFAEELYSPSNPTNEDQVNCENAFVYACNSIVDKTNAKFNQPITLHEKSRSNHEQNVGKVNQNLVSNAANQVLRNRNVFSLYAASDVKGSNSSTFDNDFGDVDYRQGTISNQMSNRGKGSSIFRTDNYFTNQRKKLTNSNLASQKDMPDWNKDYHCQELHNSLHDQKSSFSGGTEYWQDFQRTNLYEYDDTDYRQPPEMMQSYFIGPHRELQTEPEADEGLHPGGWATYQNVKPLTAPSHVSEWSHHQGESQSDDQYTQHSSLTHFDHNCEDYWTRPTSFTMNTVEQVPTEDELYQLSSESIRNQEPSQENQKVVKPIDETTATLQKILPEMFSPATHQQKCKNILKAFSLSSAPITNKPVLPAKEEEEFDYGEDPIPKQSVQQFESSSFTSLSLHQQRPLTAFQKQGDGEISSVEKLREILANVKRNATNSRTSKTQTPVGSSNTQTNIQSNSSSENKELPFPSKILQEENTKGLEKDVISPVSSSQPVEMTMKLCRQPSPSISSQFRNSADHIDQSLVKKISVEGTSLQNLSTVDELKKILNHLTEKIHASISETDAKNTPSSQKLDTLKPSSQIQPSELQGSRPPVMCLNEIFLSSEIKNVGDKDKKTTSQVFEANERHHFELADQVGQEKEKCLLESIAQETSSDKNWMVLEQKEATFSATSQKDLNKLKSCEVLHDERVLDNEDHTHIPEKRLMKDIEVKNSVRYVSKDDTGRLQVKVSNSRSTENASMIEVHNKFSNVGLEFNSKESVPEKHSSQSSESSRNTMSESLDSRVVVIDSPLSKCESPVMTGGLTQSSSNLSISIRDDGKVYLSDVSMDVLSFARDKILHQINELIDEADVEVEEDADTKCKDVVADVDAEKPVRAIAKDGPIGSCNVQTAENSGQHSETVDIDNDTEDGEIKDNEGDELSDDTVCRGDSDFIENRSDLAESHDHESAMQNNNLELRKRARVKKKEEIISVSSESDTDIVDQSKKRKKTTRGVFCKKDYGSLNLSPTYIEHCKKKRRKKKQRHKSKTNLGLNNLVVDYEFKYSDISEASNISDDSQLRHAITSPQKVQTQITSKLSPPSNTKKMLDLMPEKFSAGGSASKTSLERKKNVGLVQKMEENSLEKEDANNKHENGLSLAKADSSPDWKKKCKSSPFKYKRCENQTISSSPDEQKSYAEPSQTMDSRPSLPKVASPVSERKVSSTFGNKKNASNVSSDLNKKILPKLSSVISNPQKFCPEKGRVSRSPYRGHTEKFIILPKEPDCSKRTTPEYSISVKEKDNVSLSRDHRKRKRSISPFQKHRSRKSSTRSPTPRGARASRSSSRGCRRHSGSSPENLDKRDSYSPRFFKAKRIRHSRSSSRDYNRRRRSRSRSSSLAKHRDITYSRYRYRSPSSSERKYRRSNSDSSPVNNRNRGNCSRRSSSGSVTPDRSVIIKKRIDCRSPSAESSPFLKNRFNNELDYYTSRYSHRGQSPLWKDLPAYSLDKQSEERTVSKSVDHLGLDYYTTKKRRKDVPSQALDLEDSREVSLITPERKFLDYEKLMKEYERERHHQKNICNVTIEKLIITHYGTIIPEEIKDAFPLSFKTSVTHDSKGLVRPGEDMCKFGKMILEAYGVATSISDNPVNTANIDFRSRCFDDGFGDYQLQEFCDHQILLEVNVIKQCQAILHSDFSCSQETFSAEAMLKDKSVEQAELKAKLLNMEGNQESVSSHDLDEVKNKLALVEEEFAVLMQACVKHKQLQASKGVDTEGTSRGLPKPDLPKALRMSTADFKFCQLLDPMPEGQVKADLEALLDQVAGDILELYKCPDFGRAHFRVPDLLLLHEEKRSLYGVCGTPLILHTPMPKGAFLSLLDMRQKLESLGSKLKESSQGKKLLTERSIILARYVNDVKRASVNKLKERMRQFVCCSEYLKKVLGSDGLRKMKVLVTYEQALRWHFRFLDQEYFGS